MTLNIYYPVVAALALFFSSSACFSQDGRTAYHDFWTETEAIFSNPETSPLLPDDAARFDSIARYPFNPKYRIKATWEPAEGAKPQSVKTTTEARRRMQKAGVLKFEVGGEKISLPVYRDLTAARMKVEDPWLFLPFTDLTNGSETYGGGRYIELNESDLRGESAVIDFNVAYNPYCVYNPKYSCPIPPAENHIPVKIEAGARVEQ